MSLCIFLVTLRILCVLGDSAVENVSESFNPRDAEDAENAQSFISASACSRTL